jgi:hypothetical protein
MGKGMGKGGIRFYNTTDMLRIMYARLSPPTPGALQIFQFAGGLVTVAVREGRCRLDGSVILNVWPQMAITAGIAVFATLLRAEMGPEKYLITDVKGHATVISSTRA